MTYNPEIFDDQYIGCSEKLGDIMPKVLQKEKANKQFKDAWINATERWEDIKDFLTLPEGFEDEYGIALLTFTNQYPTGNPIHQQLNGNLTIAGASRKDYMEKFHFKALHFYLTRALQMLKPNCEETYTTYRGSPHSHDIKPLLKFGRFTSTSMDRVKAQDFGTESLFQITTCFGAWIQDLSFFPSEEEVLIPPTEKFQFVTKENSWFVLRSTGEMCSYFNCAYLKAEKREVGMCQSDTKESKEEPKDKGQTTKAIPAMTEMEERINVLEDQITRNLHYRDQLRKKIDDSITDIDIIRDIHVWSNSRLDDRINALDKSVESFREKLAHCDIIDAYLLTQLESLKEKIAKQQDHTKSLLDKERATSSIILHHQQLLRSLQEENGNLRDGLRSLLRGESTTSTSIEYHQQLLRSLQEQCRNLHGLMVVLITFFVILGLKKIYKFCCQFNN